MENSIFDSIWRQLRLKKSYYSQFLEQIDIKNLHGIKDLSVNFSFPVTVIAGPNACGKTTVLYVCACAYNNNVSNEYENEPFELFPNINLKNNKDITDTDSRFGLGFYYSIDKKKTFIETTKHALHSKTTGVVPSRSIYLRKLENLASPDIRHALDLRENDEPEISELSSDLIAFAHNILPIKFSKVNLIKVGNNDILFVNREDAIGSKYSEFHMSAGERAILRLSKDISKLRNALVLIDEVEAGLHPFTQQQLMLELQRLAIRNDLQIIVTTHSTVILDSVPEEARIFLERTDDNVIIKLPYRNIIQKAFYGQSTEKLSILCEDEIGEYFILGILDYLNPKLNFMPNDIVVGRDTGKEEFPNHITALAKFNKLNEFIFVLDGDARNLDDKLKKAATNATIKPLYLPGKDIPESWAWDVIANNIKEYADILGISPQDFEQTVKRFELMYNNATDKSSDISKNKFRTFCNEIRRKSTDIIRLLSRHEIEKQTFDIKVFADELELQIRNWQSRY